MTESLTVRSERATLEGYDASLAGKSYADNPYDASQGSKTRIEAIAWRKGYQQAEVDEAEGHHFRSSGH